MSLQLGEVMSMRNHSGFTLIELMVVIGIITVLATIAIPNFIGWLPKYRLGSAAREIFTIVQQARFLAVKENANVVVSFDPAQDSYMAFVDNGFGTNAENMIQDADEATIFSGSMPARVDMYEAVFSLNPYFYFNSKGLPSGFGHVYLQGQPGDFKNITVSITGSARIQRSNDGTTWYE